MNNAVANGDRSIVPFVPYYTEPRPGRPGKLDKKPFVHTNKYAPTGANHRNAWLSLEQAYQLRPTVEGIGIVFDPSHDIVGIDLDDCIDANGLWSQYAIDVYNWLGSPAWEASISGRGLHFYGRADKSRCPDTTDWYDNGQHVEIFTKSKFIAMSGDFTALLAGGTLNGPLPDLTEQLIGWTTAAGKNAANSAGNRLPLGHPDLAAPSLDWATRALFEVDPNELSRHEWLTASAAFKAAAWPHTDEARARWLWEVWCERYTTGRGNDPSENGTLWGSIREAEAGFKHLLHKGGLRQEYQERLALESFIANPIPIVPTVATKVAAPQITTDFVDIKSRPRVVARPLIDGVLPAASVGMLFGAPKAGKTFVTLDLALSVATGTEWNGHAVKANAGPVVYVAGEGHKGLRYRVEAWELERSIGIGRDRIRFTDAAINFGDGNALAALQSDLDALSVRPSLLVIDTLFRATVGTNVNDQEQMSKFWQICEQISRQYGCTVLVVHHTNKSESATSFGSIVSEASVDFQIAVEWDQGSRFIRSRLTKDDEPFDDICFNLKSVAAGFVEYDDGGTTVIKSCVPQYVQSSANGNTNQEKASARTMGRSMLRSPRGKDAADVLYLMARIQLAVGRECVITKEQIRTGLKESGSDRQPAHIIRDGTKSLLSSGHILPHKGKDDAWTITDDAFNLAAEDNFGIYENYDPKLEY
ncbi:AAA family ATPase [Mesorhizobium sp. B2-4-12]|uniref:AAA family ATPase n=1 Tax=Mesorhizobium sp. B2-4-12 TaxID=2589937 RepID=UPI0015E27F10|nr:AAA family ATPase [Mesorhizobium sp. B2-4-12]